MRAGLILEAALNFYFRKKEIVDMKNLTIICILFLLLTCSVSFANMRFPTTETTQAAYLNRGKAIMTTAQLRARLYKSFYHHILSKELGNRDYNYSSFQMPYMTIEIAVSCDDVDNFFDQVKNDMNRGLIRDGWQFYYQTMYTSPTDSGTCSVRFNARLYATYSSDTWTVAEARQSIQAYKDSFKSFDDNERDRDEEENELQKNRILSSDMLSTSPFQFTNAVKRITGKYFVAAFDNPGSFFSETNEGDISLRTNHESFYFDFRGLKIGDPFDKIKEWAQEAEKSIQTSEIGQNGWTVKIGQTIPIDETVIEGVYRSSLFLEITPKE